MRVPLVQPVDILHQPAASLQLLGQEDRREVRPATAQQGHPITVIAPDKSRYDHDRPPAQWGLERRREYFEWAKRVIDGLRGAHPGLEAAFDAAYRLKP